MYADAFGLLVFGAPLISVSLSKNKFFDRLNYGQMQHLSVIFIFLSAASASSLVY